MTPVEVRGCVDVIEADIQLAMAKVLRREAEAVPQALNFFLLGGTSMRAALLLRDVERSFGVKIPLPRFLRRPTVEHLAALVRDGRMQDPWAERSPHLTHFGGPDGDPATLFFVPHEADAALLRQVDPDHVAGPMYAAIPLRSAEARAGHLGVPELADLYAAEAETVSGREWVVGGFCAAAALAWETANRLATAGHPVARVVLIDPPMPGPWPRPLPLWLYLSFTPTEEAVTALPPDERLALDRQEDPAAMLPGLLRLLRTGIEQRLALGADVAVSEEDRRHLGLLAEASLRQTLATAWYAVSGPGRSPVTVVESSSAGIRSQVFGELWAEHGGDPFVLERSTRTRFGVFGDPDFAALLAGRHS